MDDVKICNKCEKISPKTDFYKSKNNKDGHLNECKNCSKNYTIRNQEKIKNYKKQYFHQNKERIIEYNKQYFKNRIKTDVNYRLITYTRRRNYKSLKGMAKQSSTLEILGIDVDTYRKWLEFHFTPEMNWSHIEIDHVKPICMFDVSDDEQLKEIFAWKNTQPLLKHDHHQKGVKYNFLDYQLQFIKAYQFIKLNEERFNENVH